MIPKYARIKPGMEKRFEEAMTSAIRIKSGIGYSQTARLMADLRVDQAIFGYKLKGNARIRRKKYKRYLQQSLLQSVADCLEALNNHTNHVPQVGPVPPPTPAVMP